MGKFAGYGAEIIFTHLVLSIIAGIVCIDETYANSVLAVYGYDKSYWIEA